MNYREKDQSRRPRDLQDISHLYLSSSTSTVPAAPPRVLVALSCSCDAPWRSFTAAGMARALESAGMDVVLLETGRALPNAGYYFAMEPSAYLHPVLDPRAVVSGPRTGSLRFHYARDPARLPLPPREGGVPGRARIVLFAFDRSVIGAQPAVPVRFHDLLCAAPERSGTASPADAPADRRVALVTAGPDAGDRFLDLLRLRFEESFPGAPTLAVPEEPGGAPPAGIARRSPPALDLFGGVAAALLQRLARGREAPE